MKKIDKKYVWITIVVLGVMVIGGVMVGINNNKDRVASYNKVKNMIKKKDRALIYYYNSKSTNEDNMDIKKYLDEKKINYYVYDDAQVSRDEYNKLLDMLKIDKMLFGTPAIIYIYQGRMYANLVNIDNKKVIDNFIKDYDLYTVK